MASEVAGYKGTMADSDSRGSEKPEGSESGLKRLENLGIKITQELEQEIRQVIKQGFGEIKQETSTVVVQLDWSREEFREELVAARRRCEGSTEAVRSEVEEEVVAAQSPVSDQQLCGVTGHCELSLCCRHGRILSVWVELPVWECSV